MEGANKGKKMQRPGLPNICKKKNPSGKIVYFPDYLDPISGKRIRETTGSRKTDAEKRKMQIYNDLMAQYLGQPSEPLESICIADLISKFIKSKENRVSKSTIKRYEIYKDNFLEFMSSNFPAIQQIKDVKKDYIIEYLNHRRDIGRAVKTINGELQFIKSIFLYAVNEEHLIKSSLHSIRQFQDSSPSMKVKFWTKDEVDLILNSLPQWCKNHFEFLYHTGLRKEELINLTWDDVEVTGSKTRITIQSKDDWTPKTNCRRIVHLNPIAVGIIKAQSKATDHNYVFKGKEGNKVHHGRIYVSLKTTLKKIGLEGNIHKFRHTFASHLVMRGAGIEIVSKILGHSSILMTMKYAHFAPEHLCLVFLSSALSALES